MALAESITTPPAAALPSSLQLSHMEISDCAHSPVENVEVVSVPPPVALRCAYSRTVQMAQKPTMTGLN
jgi:hypothetical protein